MATVTPPNPASPSSADSTRAPAKVFAAWTDPEKLKRWMGPGEVEPLLAEADRARRRPLPHRDASAETAKNTTSAASIAK